VASRHWMQRVIRTEATRADLWLYSLAMAQLIVRSLDGTSISSESHGEGQPPLVIVSGALFSSLRWLPSLPLLTAERRVYVIDRRGRGQSGDAAAYAPEREIEDVWEVLAAIERPLELLGHSSGAILALQVAARQPSNLLRLIAYEPPVFFSEADRIAQDLPERLDALLASGQPEAAVETFLREGPRASEAELLGVRQGSSWLPMVEAFAHTVPYDSRIQRAYAADPAELSRVRVPTLMLVGAKSPARMRVGAEAIASRIPNARIREVPGQHAAMLTAPAEFAAAVALRF